MYVYILNFQALPDVMEIKLAGITKWNYQMLDYIFPNIF